ncbi:MAG: type II secretion system protein [Candidatus Gastranaerophilales bacterium]
MKKINLNIKKAFTLAEMLITIGILGVVASMTLPTLMNNYQTEALAKKKLLFDERLEEAMNQMRFHEKLDGYNQTSDFVEELAKYLKINEICDVYNLTTCFYEEFKTNDGEIVDVATLTHGTDFALSGDEQDFSSENTSVTFADGTKAIMNYDKNCSWLDPYEGSSNREEATSCIAMIYDLNGGKGKNKIAEDISNLNGDFQLCLDTGTCWDLYYTSSTYLNTCDGSEYIDYDSTGSSNSYCATNYWAG